MGIQARLTAGWAITTIMLGLSGTAQADPKDYRFEAVEPQVAVSPTATVAVRLVHLPDGKPVGNAIVFQPKLEMPMSGMAPMPTKVTPGTPDGKGLYPFIADIPMAGPWTLSVSAKVQGETATISGTIALKAIQSPTDHGHSH